MKTLLLCLLPVFGYCQSNDARTLFLAINDQRSEWKFPKLSYREGQQTELDTRAIKISVSDTNTTTDNCGCSYEQVISATTFKDLIKTAIDSTHTWHHLDPKERNAAVSVVNMDGKFYAVIRTYSMLDYIK